MVAHAVINNLPGISEEREEKFEQMCEQYERLSTESAERLLGYWQASQLGREAPQ
jgi:hypothetical protein